MSETAPKPPTKRLLAGACLSGGTTAGMMAITAAGQFIYDGIPSDRLAIYALAILVGVCITGTLVARYLIQKHRRDAWWDGYATGDEPSAEVIQLHAAKGAESKKGRFVNGSSS